MSTLDTSSQPTSDRDSLDTTSSPPLASPESACDIQRLVQAFLKQNTAYDMLAVSYRLIVLDTRLLVKKALATLVQQGIVSAPLWDSATQSFAGMLTVADFINLIKYYYTHASVDEALKDIEKCELADLRRVEKQIGASSPQRLYLDPMASLYDTCHLLVKSRAHRVPLLDKGRKPGVDMIVSVVTQYRILKFIAVNFTESHVLRQPLSVLKIGTYENIATATMDTPVIEIINTFADLNISAVPIVDKDGIVLNVYETIDVMSIVRSEKYYQLDIPVGEALASRPSNYPGVHTCRLNDTLLSIFRTIRKQRVYRLIVVDENNKLIGIVSLSNILGHLIGYQDS